MEIVEIGQKIEIWGISAVSDNKSEQNSDAKIPTLWRKFMSEIYDSKSQIYAIYSDYESDCDGRYKICIGTQSAKPNLTQAEIYPGTYAVFSKVGTPEQIVSGLWGEIWKFFQDSQLQRVYKSDFELYGAKSVKIYIGVKGIK